MAEYIYREDALKCLEYITIQNPSANDVVSATLRVAREKRSLLTGATLTQPRRRAKTMC